MVGPSRATYPLTPEAEDGNDTSDWLANHAAEMKQQYGDPIPYMRAILSNPDEWSKQYGDPIPYMRKMMRENSDADVVSPRMTSSRTTPMTENEVTDEEREDRRRMKVDKKKVVSHVSTKLVGGTDHSIAESSTEVTRERVPLPRSKAAAIDEQSSTLFVQDDITTDDYQPLELPAWYTKIKMTDRAMKELGKRPTSSQTQALKALQSMKGYIDRCENSGKSGPSQLGKYFEELRDQVHKAEITLKVDRYIIRKAKMLETDCGLPRIFASEQYPWDLRADAWQLYNRWRDEVFEIDLLRGIKAKEGTDRNADSIDPSWKGKYSSKYYGEGNLVLGQWWPTQLCTYRDGAHGSVQGGISGDKDKGAYSIVMSGAGNLLYDDEDNGDEIWYSGTDGKDFTPTENTLRLIESCDTVHNKVRVLRSHQLPKKNPYRPAVGLRYDGLYEVMEKGLVDPKKQSYKFRLRRCTGQHPIRCEDNAARRPTIFEIEEFQRLRKAGR